MGARDDSHADTVYAAGILVGLANLLSAGDHETVDIVRGELRCSRKLARLLRKKAREQALTSTLHLTKGGSVVFMGCKVTVQ